MSAAAQTRPRSTLHLPSRPAEKAPPPVPRAAAAPPAPPVAPARRAEPTDEQIAQRVAALALCRETWPGAFDADNPKPLAIGVGKQLAELIGADAAHALLRWWTSWPGYVRAIAAGAMRYHLDGSVAGEITDEHRDAARATIARRAAGWLGPLAATSEAGATASPQADRE